MMARTQITLGSELHRLARKRAAELGISLAEYVRNLIARDLAAVPKSVDPSIVFALGRSSGSDVANAKDALIAEALGSRRSGRTRSRRTR